MANNNATDTGVIFLGYHQGFVGGGDPTKIM
jgi:hypothetical protein